LELIIAELNAGFGGFQELVRPILRLLFAMLCGAVIGLQRERAGKAAGLRTHILVAAGSTLFIVAGVEGALDAEGVSRVIQGLVTGIGFLGAGAILKRERENDIKGLTTAAGIWMTSAIGVTAGLGRFGVALAATVVTWIVLSVLREIERWGENDRLAAERPERDSAFADRGALSVTDPIERETRDGDHTERDPALHTADHADRPVGAEAEGIARRGPARRVE
jgi:putative Mg2+ transporter-C (MgtC) family protein